MKTKQKSSLTLQSKKDIRNSILEMLEQDQITREEIFESVQSNYGVGPSELRTIVREIRTEFLNKLNVLQSGIVRL